MGNCIALSCVVLYWFVLCTVGVVWYSRRSSVRAAVSFRTSLFGSIAV